MDNFVICQVCGAKIDVSKALYLQIEQTLKNHYEQEFHKKDEQFKQAIEQLENQRREIEAEKYRLNQIVQEQVEARLTSEKQQLEENLKNQIYNENKTHIEALKQELNEKSQKIAELNNALAEIERLKREKQEIESRLKLEFEKQLTDNILLEQEKLRKHYEDNFLLKLKEKDKTIEDLMAKLEDARRRAEQGSMQLQGEVQELFLEEMLKELFPLDEIQEVKKGQRGGDIINARHDGNAAGNDGGHVRHLPGPDSTQLVRLQANLICLNVVTDQCIVHRSRNTVVRFVAWYKRWHIGPTIIVKRRKMIEVEYVRLNVVCPLHDIANDAPIRWRHDAESILQRLSRCNRMRGRAYTTESLGDLHRIQGIATDEDLFKAPIQRATNFRIDNLPGVCCRFNLEMTFDAGHRINDDMCSDCTHRYLR